MKSKKNITRRTFLNRSLLAGGSLFAIAHLPFSTIRGNFTLASADIAAVKNPAPFDATFKSVEALGGMSRFVTKGDRVGILVNGPEWWKNPGSYTNTDVVLATAKMCLDAGAKELVYLIALAPDFWDRSELSKQYKNVIKGFSMHSNEYPEVQIEKGVSLKRAEVIKDLHDCDVFINIPVIKNHLGTRFTGSLKNMMGCCTHKTNKFFHEGSGASGDYDDIEFLSQCIADLNLVRKPDLCIADATTILASNGPWGPGELLSPSTVIAGTDPVATDSYATRVLNLLPGEVRMIELAARHNLGKADISGLVVKELSE